MVKYNWSIHLPTHSAVHYLSYTVHHFSLYGSDQSQPSLFIAYWLYILMFLNPCIVVVWYFQEMVRIYPQNRKIQNAKLSSFRLFPPYAQNSCSNFIFHFICKLEYQHNVSMTKILFLHEFQLQSQGNAVKAFIMFLLHFTLVLVSENYFYLIGCRYQQKLRPYCRNLCGSQTQEQKC